MQEDDLPSARTMPGNRFNRFGRWPILRTRIALLLLRGRAFFFGYLFTLRTLLAHTTFVKAAKLAFAADTVSIAIMEVVDNAIMLVIPGAMDAALSSPLFWTSLAVSLALAAVTAFPVNRWLLARGKGHAVVHAHR